MPNVLRSDKNAPKELKESTKEGCRQILTLIFYSATMWLVHCAKNLKDTFTCHELSIESGLGKNTVTKILSGSSGYFKIEKSATTKDPQIYALSSKGKTCISWFPTKLCHSLNHKPPSPHHISKPNHTSELPSSGFKTCIRGALGVQNLLY